MTIDEIYEILVSTSAEDWIHSDELNAFTYKCDVMLRIQQRPVDYNDNFADEDWAVNHPCADAYRVVYDVFYGMSFIATKLLIAVDGGRARLPMPKHGTLEICRVM